MNKNEMNAVLYSYKKVDRNKLFIAVKIENFIEKAEDIVEQLDKYLKILGIEYADSILLHTPKASKIPLKDSFNELEVDWQDNGGTPIYKFANQVE